MAQMKVCPFCQLELESHVEHCEHCGRPLPANKPQFFTTQNVAKSQTEVTAFLPSVAHLGELSKNTLVLFLAGDDNPIILEDVQDVILGRPVAKIPETRTVDLTKYGAVMLGVSRHHVQITYADESFSVVDLGSTNGTSVNGRSLLPARSQRLRPFDQLTLGQLRLVVYFEVEPGDQGKNLLLTDRRAIQPLILTPDYLISTLIPYIQALVGLQKISREVRNQPVENIQVQYIQLGKRPAQIRIGLMMADEAIDMVRQRIGPWQHIYSDLSLITADQNDEILLSKLHDLVASIVDHLIISFSERETLVLQERLLAPVRFIATSGLELTLEALDS
jgi:pSer/pThr/pTyr-binding forkhead associated (FHA) protein